MLPKIYIQNIETHIDKFKVNPQYSETIRINNDLTIFTVKSVWLNYHVKFNFLGIVKSNYLILIKTRN